MYSSVLISVPKNNAVIHVTRTLCTCTTSYNIFQCKKKKKTTRALDSKCNFYVLGRLFSHFKILLSTRKRSRTVYRPELLRWLISASSLGLTRFGRARVHGNTRTRWKRFSDAGTSGHKYRSGLQCFYCTVSTID